LGVEIFPVIHMKSKEKIYVSLEDIKWKNGMKFLHLLDQV
jgi:hypothetical protein